MKYKGWTYSSDYEHDDGDVRKLAHWATNDDGRVVDLDFSPYNNRVKKISFEAMVELDFPSRCDMVNSTGPIYEEDLLELYIAHLKRKHEGNEDDRKNTAD